MSKRKIHPNSLENLNREGRPFAFGEEKKRRYLTVTQTGWEGTHDIASTHHCSGVSELLEKLGRGELMILAPSEENFTSEELAESDSAWQSYLNGDDLGLSAEALKAELFS
ncbi:MAG: hypothetical protein ACFCU8_09355 [Thermosynechococcaceae cyanobacterium]